MCHVKGGLLLIKKKTSNSSVDHSQKVLINEIVPFWNI